MDPVCQSTEPSLPKPDCDAPDARATVPPHLPIVTVEPQITTVLPDPDPTVVVDPHLLMMFESSETLFILSTLILLVIIIEIYTLLLQFLNRLHLLQQ